MKGDFSRIRFTPQKNYTAVLQQQGRVALDADANEQTAIDAYLRDTTNVDVIGSYGAPANNAGFAIKIENGKIRIGAGRYYVDGILVENDRERNYGDQQFLMIGSSDPRSEASLLNALSGGSESVQFVLQVWRRFVTELDDLCLVEPAIGQADTTARLQTIWRVVGNAATASLQSSATAVVSAAGSNLEVTAESSSTGNCNKNPLLQLSSCCQGLYRVLPQQHTGRMKAWTNPAGNDCGCQPIPAAGYQGLENQLYRVEIHTGGDFSTATFKWSRENASVVAQVTQINGAIVTANSLGPDANLGFQVNQWVELSDDTSLYGDTPNQPGALYQIAALGPGPLQVTLSGSPTVDPSKNARMRRWDQSGASAVSGDIPLSSAPFTLEYGIEIEFSKDGNYVSGDYWTIPARAANGQIDWACGASGDPFLSPGYFTIYQAPLACVQLSAGASAPAGGNTKQNQQPDYIIQDCRIKFPPLTAITCGDQGPCTIIPRPGAGWEEPLLALKQGADADICFPVGKFPLTKPLILSGLGNLRLSGGGFGTQIIATGVSAALIFSECTSVAISDLYASTDTVLIRSKRVGRPDLGGTLSFADCTIVAIDSVALKCGHAAERTAACITVENSFVPQVKTTLKTKASKTTPITGTGEVRIRHCDLSVGGGQEGILLVRVARAQIEDNTLIAYVPTRKYTLSDRLQNRAWRANALRVFISGAQYIKAVTYGQKAEARSEKDAAQPATQPATPPAPAQSSPEPTPAPTPESTPAPSQSASAGAPPANAPKTAPSAKADASTPADTDVPPIKQKIPTRVTAGGQTIEFLTHPLLREFWQPYLDQYAPKTFSTNRDLLLFMKKAARSFLLQPKLIRGNSALISVIAGIDKADQTAMARAISVGGEGIEECRILNNSIHDAVQGITVGMSNHKQYPYTAESSTVVTIAGNQIYVGLPSGAQFQATQAIFVGNVNSLLIENNVSEVLANPDQVSREGIKVWGVFGRRIIVRDSHLAGYQPGIWFNPVLPPRGEDGRPPLWLVEDNMAENASPVVYQPGTVPPVMTNKWINNLS
jgi:hypothetical protein